MFLQRIEKFYCFSSIYIKYVQFFLLYARNAYDCETCTTCITLKILTFKLLNLALFTTKKLLSISDVLEKFSCFLKNMQELFIFSCLQKNTTFDLYMKQSKLFLQGMVYTNMKVLPINNSLLI